MTNPPLLDALRRALTRNRLAPAPPDTDIESAIRRAFGLTDEPTTTQTPAPTTTPTSLAHQDHALAARLGATVHTPNQNH